MYVVTLTSVLEKISRIIVVIDVRVSCHSKSSRTLLSTARYNYASARAEKYKIIERAGKVK
jgi:hypothetical protein